MLAIMHPLPVGWTLAKGELLSRALHVVQVDGDTLLRQGWVWVKEGGAMNSCL